MSELTQYYFRINQNLIINFMSNYKIIIKLASPMNEHDWWNVEASIFTKIALQ